MVDRSPNLAAPELQEVASLVRIAPHRRAILTSCTGRLRIQCKPVANPNKAASTQELGARDSHRLWKGFINRDKVAFRGWLSHFISELLKPGKREGPLWTTAVLLCCASYFGACEPGNRSPSLTCNPVSACLALRRIETDTNSASGLEPAVCRDPATLGADREPWIGRNQRF